MTMSLDTLQCIASALPWRHSSSFSASSCMVLAAVKTPGLEYRMASGVSRSSYMWEPLWEHFSSQVESSQKVLEH